MGNYIIYKIQKGDTLESIAKAHNTTVKELVRFHNSHCGITQLLNEDRLPLHLSDIYIINPEADMRAVNPLPEVPPYVNVWVYEKQASLLYDIHIKTSVVFLGKKISENETVLQWQLDFNTPQHGYLDKRETLRKSVKEFPRIRLVNTVLDAMNEATDKLFFRLNTAGGIDAVMNHYEVQKRWEAIKVERLKTIELNIPELAAMFKLCDEEFSNLYGSLQNNLLYTLFFLPVGNLYLSRDEAFTRFSERKVLSQFFQPAFIPFSLHYHAAKEEEDCTQLRLIGKADRKWLEAQFTKSFKEKYAAISQMPPDFDYGIEGYYRYDDEGLMQQGKVFVREQVNLNCFYTAEYEFKRINT